MKKILTLMLAATLLASCDKQFSADTQVTSEHTHLPDMRLSQAPPQKPLDLSQFKGKPVLVNFWATWCAPCVKEMPSLGALAQEQQGKLVVIAASQDLEGWKVLTPWLKAHALPAALMVAHDDDLALMGAVSKGQGESTSLPTSIFYDKQGNEIWRISGGRDWTSPEAKALIAKAL
jgi:thiol-disulfide isomerase/thioredoxin